MSQKKILMICIPTFNRVKLLAECVNSIITQIDDRLKQLMEIHIFDNCSSDGTEMYCKGLVSRYPYVKYERNDENLGSDGNFYKILQYKADVGFKHLLSDDDKYAPQALRGLVDYLTENDTLHFVYLNYANFRTANSADRYDILSRAFETKSYITKHELIDIIGNEYSFLSGMIFNNNVIELSQMERFRNTYWLQSYVLFNSTVNSEGKLSFYGPLAVLKRSDDGEADYNKLQVFGQNYFELARFAYEKCGYERKQMLKTVAIRWKKLIFWARLNRFPKSEYAKILEISKKEKGLRKIQFYAKMPHWSCVLYHKLKYMFKRRS